MALTNKVKPSSPFTKPLTAAAHEDTGAIIQTGAAVASIKYASLHVIRYACQLPDALHYQL